MEVEAKMEHGQILNMGENFEIIRTAKGLTLNCYFEDRQEVEIAFTAKIEDGKLVVYPKIANILYK